jgi:hypothetical protein
VVGALSCEGRVYQESKHAQTIVDSYQHYVLGAPLLTVELRLRTESLAIAATVYPQGYWQFLVCFSRSLGPYVQIQTVLAECSLLAITPLGVISTGILNGLITRTTECVANLNSLPGHYGLRCLPAVLLDRRCSIRYTTINKHVRMIIGQYALHTTTFDSQHWIFGSVSTYCYYQQKR